MLAPLRGIRNVVNDRLRQLDPVKAAIEGTLDRQVYVRYLARIANQYAKHSPRVMCLAASRCSSSHPKLMEYLLKHASEERHHDEWAAQDLRGCKAKRTKSEYPVPACSAMIAYTYYLADYGNPVALFGWMYILEAVGADLGADVAQGLKQMKLPAHFVGGHAVADQSHTQEIEDCLRKYVRDATDQADVIHAAEVSADLYVRMFEQAQAAGD